MHGLRDKIAIVTGGASGIGEAIASFIAGHGGTVVIADKDIIKAKQVAGRLSARTRAVDVADNLQMTAMIQQVKEEFGRIDFLFNNAGQAINGEFQDISIKQYEQIINTNLWGVINGCHAVYPIMQKQGFGHIVNVASMAGLVSLSLASGYAASKSAVVGLSLSLRGEARQYGVKVSVVCPGYIRTPMLKHVINASPFLNSEKNRAADANAGYARPEDIIGPLMSQVRKNKSIIIVPGRYRFFWWFYRLLPGIVPVIWKKIIREMKKE